MATRPTTKHQPLAFVEVGLVDLLMPLPKALQLVELLQYAVTCTSDFNDHHHRRFVPGATPDVSIVNVRPEQVIAPTQPINPRRRMSVPLSLPKD